MNKQKLNDYYYRMTVKNFGKLLQKERKKTGLSIANFAKKCFLSSSALEQFENGIRRPTLDALSRIGDFLYGGIVYQKRDFR